MVKKLIKILIFLIIVVCIMLGIYIYSTTLSVKNLTTDYKTISSKKIPKELDNIHIAFISDIHFNGFMDKDRLDSMILKIKEHHPDVILFGGDLFDHPEINVPSEKIQQQLISELKSLDAPLGKFAVLGEQDLMNEEIRNICTNILTQSEFEIVTNKSIRLRNGSNSSITLIGIDSLVNGTPEIDQAFSSVSADQFNLVITHAPDVVKNFPANASDLILSGHSHGGQISIPLLGTFNKIDGATEYISGEYKVKNATLHISNGLGTTEKDIRLFTPAEVLIYQLKSLN